MHQDGGVTVYSGKVDLGTGLRIAMRQMVAEELGIPVERIALIEGDTALTPDQGPTSGSTGIAKGGVQIRQAAATARQALVKLAVERLKTAAGRARRGEWHGQSKDRRQERADSALSSAASASPSSSMPRRRSAIPGPILWWASRCRGRTCRRR